MIPPLWSSLIYSTCTCHCMVFNFVSPEKQWQASVRDMENAIIVLQPWLTLLRVTITTIVLLL